MEGLGGDGSLASEYSELELIRVVWARADFGDSSAQIRAHASWPTSTVDCESRFIE